LQKVLSFTPQKSKTDIAKALKYLLSVKKSNAIVFVISDFIDDIVETYLAQAARKYDFIAVRCLDYNEKEIPAVGFITVEDIETGELVELDARGKNKNAMKQFLAARLNDQNKLFRKNGVDFFDVSPDKTDYLVDVIKFFRRRMMY